MRVSTSHMQNTAVQNMTGQQSEINDTQTQLSSGRRVLRPSDDPTSAARTLDLKRATESVERFNRNGDLARTRLSMSESALEQAGNELQRIRELTVQAANGSQDADTRSYIAAEIEERYKQLVELGNSRDGNGEYLFSGSRTRTQPFNMGTDGHVTYHGDQNSRQVRIGPGRQIGVDHSGFDAFMKVPDGNGQYQAYQGEGNRGTGVVSVVDGKVRGLGAEQYRIRFAEDDDGNTRYAIQRTDNPEDENAWEWVGGENGGPPAVEDAPLYEPGATIEVDDGVRVKIEGNPDPGQGGFEDGDRFTVTGSRSQSIFATVNELIGALKEGEGPDFRNAADRALGDLDLAMENTFRVRAEIGARLSTLDSEKASNEAAIIDLKQATSDERDLDYAEATGRFNQELTGLEAAQSTFGRVQNLSLFDYI
ncbi:flagellar hook-associated protein FlgL [Halorhodospira sp. 9622]|uniref:flagellar hook-associated protein FlgL n=1 Tax=Halorhodospira sp. 9622 TaxID=2899136 RepID=UPI001EE84213|nr:flagellar hook-associated protein FlgL [Halorhodospira sp. 9622]